MLNNRKSAFCGVVVATITALTVSQAVAQSCRGGLLFDTPTGNPIIDPGTNTQAKCGDTSAQNTGASNGLLIAGGVTAAVAGTVGGLAAAGAFNGASNTQPIVTVSPPAPVSNQ